MTDFYTKCNTGLKWSNLNLAYSFGLFIVKIGSVCLMKWSLKIHLHGNKKYLQEKLILAKHLICFLLDWVKIFLEKSDKRLTDRLLNIWTLEAYLEPSKTSTMEFFLKSPFADVQMGSKYASALCTYTYRNRVSCLTIQIADSVANMFSHYVAL